MDKPIENKHNVHASTHTSLVVDLNADVGEGFPNDTDLIPLITSANIACGGHAGNRQTLLNTLALCRQYGVSAGAHPSFPDRVHFGRRAIAWTPSLIHEWISEQLQLAADCCAESGVTLNHVKPHGALYNFSAADPELAAVIAQSVFRFNPQLKLYGLAGSHSLREATQAGLHAVPEFFADRRYQAANALVARNHPDALLQTSDQVVSQVLNLVLNKIIQTIDNQIIDVKSIYNPPITICLHGDGLQALAFASAIRQAFTRHQVAIKSTAHAPNSN